MSLFKQKFRCPVCQGKVTVIPQGIGATLRHSKPLCFAEPKDLLRAYVIACKPRMVYPKIEGHEIIEKWTNGKSSAESSED